ncbi:MAG: 6-bladed beta-propeller [Rikenellaceae bacterium]
MKKITILFLLFTLVSCQGGVEPVATIVDGVVTLNTKDLKDTIDMKLSDFVEDLEIIQLDSDPDAYVSSYPSPYISENYLIFTPQQGQAKLFSRKTGKFLANIGSRGKGPGEYTYINYCAVNEKRGTIYIVGQFAAEWINEYDLSGKFIRKIPLAGDRAFDHTCFTIDDDKDIITVYACPQNAIVWQQDFEGNALTDLVKIPRKTKLFIQKINMTGDSFNIYANNFYNKQDTLFKYDKSSHSLKPIFTIKINEASEVENLDDTKYSATYLETPSHLLSVISETKIESANRGTSMRSIPLNYIAVNKKNLSASYIKLHNDYLYNWSPTYISADKDCFIQCCNYESLTYLRENMTDEQRENMNPNMLQRLEDLYEDIDEESNTIVLLGKFVVD